MMMASDAPGYAAVGSEPAAGEEGRSTLTAAIPQLELIDYAIALRSLVARRRPGLRQGRRTEPRTSGGTQRRIGVAA